MPIALEVDVYYDHVMIFGQRVNRPSRISVSQWFEIWETKRRSSWL
jgi:hypothetical protein